MFRVPKGRRSSEVGEINITAHYESKDAETTVVSLGVVELWGSKFGGSICLHKGRVTLKLFGHDSVFLGLSIKL